jgi:hypothetical protein
LAAALLRRKDYKSNYSCLLNIDFSIKYLANVF